eukprot:TRINITY_DN10060_c0_g1_i2.p1 TRINITY_DN10060_c0_g1~~TRINITY_DN10060_c0_g1_i2.p1  ORF type:complete len:368 (+),score=104.25 TRINITY_DN10060_c0_g1_i2:71-1174(+)
MHSILNLAGDLQTQSQEIFDRLDAACGHVDARLEDLEARLAKAASRVEAARGSTKPLVVNSSRTFCGRGPPRLQAAARALHEDAVQARAVCLPEEAVEAPLVKSSAEDLARAVRCVAPRGASTQVDPQRTKHGEKLLPPHGRLTSVSELFLVNSSEQPYQARHEVDNLAAPEDESFFQPPELVRRVRDTGSGLDAVDLNLEEDEEPERLAEDLRFRPRKSAQVTLDLPDVLPDLGHVAHLVWREGEHAGEMERPAWDAPLRELTRSVPAPVAKAARAPPPAPPQQAPRAVPNVPSPPRQQATLATSSGAVAQATEATPPKAPAAPAAAPAAPAAAPAAPAAKTTGQGDKGTKGKGKGKGKGGKGKKE